MGPLLVLLLIIKHWFPNFLSLLLFCHVGELFVVLFGDGSLLAKFVWRGMLFSGQEERLSGCFFWVLMSFVEWLKRFVQIINQVASTGCHMQSFQLKKLWWKRFLGLFFDSGFGYFIECCKKVKIKLTNGLMTYCF